MALQHHIHLPPDIKATELDIIMSNALLRAAHGLLLSEKRLIAIALAKTRIRTWPEGFKEPLDGLSMRETELIHAENWAEWTSLPDSPFVVRLSAADYAKHFGIKLSAAYEGLAAAADKLESRKIRMPIKTAKGSDVLSFGWTYYVRYSKGSGFIELHWHPMLARHIFGYGGKTGRGNFTRYKLGQASMFESIYTWRLFEIFVSLKHGEYKVGIDDFLSVMDAPEKYAKDFYTVRSRIINVAVDELNERHKLQVEWDTVNAGRKVIGLSFKYDKDVARALGELNPAQVSALDSIE